MAIVTAHETSPGTSTHTRLPNLFIWPARILWLVCVGLIVYTLAVNGTAYFHDWQFGGPLTQTVVHDGLIPAIFFPVETICVALLASVYFLSGLLIALRRNDDWLTLATSLFLMTYAAYMVFRYYALQAAPLWVDLVLDAVQTATWFTFGALFANGRPQPRWIVPVLLVGFIYITGANLIFPTMFYSFPDWHLFIRESAFNIVVAGAQVYRYFKVSTPTEKQISKWTVSGFVLGVIGDTALSFGGLRAAQGMTIYLIVRPIATLFLLFGVLSLMAAITRYRLWDIDFLINRSLVYGALTALLGMVFIGVFFGAHAALDVILGGQQDLLAIGISTLVIAATFQPARVRLRRLIDQRLYGIEIDYRALAKSGSMTAPSGRSTGDTATSFGAYKGIKLIARGGMGEVYLGEHPTLKRRVAIKILPAHAISDNAEKRFLREAHTIGGLKHPNIIELIEAGEQGGKPYMVMEYIDGVDVRDIIKRHGRLTLADALPILQDVAAALDFAHHNGVIHRDVKPSNVMIDKIITSGSQRTQRAVLMDFGIAKGDGEATNLTQSGLIGTLDYISPEQIHGAADVDSRTDIYSLGVMSFQMLTGELPFKHANPGAMVLAHLMQPAPDPRTVDPDIPEAAAVAIMQALSKKPEQRFDSAGEFVAALG